MTSIRSLETADAASAHGSEKSAELIRTFAWLVVPSAAAVPAPMSRWSSAPFALRDLRRAPAARHHVHHAVADHVREHQPQRADPARRVTEDEPAGEGVAPDPCALQREHERHPRQRLPDQFEDDLGPGVVDDRDEQRDPAEREPDADPRRPPPRLRGRHRLRLATPRP
jgi:hypothetical protein